ncbi:MAG: methyltransferase [Verrucomicrobia bacterium]|nr:methyltransferase [Verrucomicrobiota bacterium]
MPSAEYQIVQLRNGSFSLRSLAAGETFHPVIGPAAEADTLYVRQLRLVERVREAAGSEFVVWDVGLGGAANALAALHATQALDCSLRLLSFDRTLEPLRFALENSAALGYFAGYEALVRDLHSANEASSTRGTQRIRWTALVTDFPTFITESPIGADDGHPPPHAILFDPFSPAANPAMWTLPVLGALHAWLDPARPCALATYSRATMIRVALLLAGFFVGRGLATGEKEETTLAANSTALLDAPLDRRWLDRARRSGAAEPLAGPHYQRAPLRDETWEKLRGHPQFA